MAESKIEWTQHTWNPVTGCTKISPGCKNCYAETMSRRLKAMGATGYANGFELTLHHDRLDQPRRRSLATTYFVNSMSDLFHEGVPDSFIEQVLKTCRECPQHTFQILTKRAERLRRFFNRRTCPKNVWLGVSVEDQKYGLPRVDELRRARAETRFLSIEPLLEEISNIDLTGISWVIVGGESGAAARPMRLDWVQSIQRACERQNVAFFFKQWGTWGPDGRRRSKAANGRKLDGREWNELPA